jgi:hypothetical protein
MKLEIDTNTKCIKIEHMVNLKELFTLLNNLFPDFAWHEYNLEVSIISAWSTRDIGQQIYVPYNQPVYPNQPGTIQQQPWPWITQTGSTYLIDTKHDEKEGTL